jgi:hypothetical protein
MLLLRSIGVGVLLLAISFTACAPDNDSVGPGSQDISTRTPSFTTGLGSSSSLLGRSTFNDPKDPNFKIKRIADDWQVEVRAKPAFDLAVQSITFPAGSHSGWHRHPGPVFIQVVSGTMTFSESDDPTCTPIVRTAVINPAYLDAGDDAHIARNESGAPAQTVVTYFAPPGAALRIDAPRPGNCPF